MAYIALNNELPGIRGLVTFRPETGQHLYDLAEILLRGESPIPSADRELIAAYVSRKNDCVFCCNSHAAAARYLYQAEQGLVDLVLDNAEEAAIQEKLKAFLAIAARVAEDARTVDEQHVQRARRAGATDREIHDTVLIAASFCMFNRYVDGLGAETPDDPSVYAAMGERMGSMGYVLKR